MKLYAIKNYFKKHPRFWLSLFIFTLIFILLGLPFYNWGFMNDDFGVVFHSKIKSLKDILRFFIEGHSGDSLQPSNFVASEKNFFSVYYRPVAFMLHSIVTAICGFNPYGHYLAFTLFHALNSVLVFNFFCFFFNISLAFLGAMFFAFHPSLCSWFGWIAGFQQVANFTFIALIVILFKKYLDSQKDSSSAVAKKTHAYQVGDELGYGEISRATALKPLRASLLRCIYYLSSIFIFLVALFTRETVIFFPAVILLWTFVDKKYCKRGEICKCSMQSTCSSICLFFKSILTVSGFIFVGIFYFLFRLYLFPFKLDSSEHSQLLSFFTNLSSRFFDLVTFLSDLAGLAFLPNGHQVLKGSLIICIFSFLIFLFIKSREKKLILFLLVICTILMWPAIARYYSSRYLYKALPLFIFILLIFIRDFCQGKSTLVFKKVMIFAWLLVSFNMFFLFVVLKNYECLYHKIHVAFDELCMDARVQQRPLCFVGIPYGFFPTGAAQAVWMRGISTDHPIYYDRRTFGFSHLPVYENVIKVIPSEDGFKIICTDLNKLTLSCIGQAKESNLGDFVFNKKDNNYSESDFVFHKKYSDQNPLLITWDYKNLKFIIL